MQDKFNYNLWMPKNYGVGAAIATAWIVDTIDPAAKFPTKDWDPAAKDPAAIPVDPTPTTEATNGVANPPVQ